MAKAEATVEELVGMIQRGELRLPEMQRRYVWRSPRVRDLLDSLYRGYPSGAILLWETDEAVPMQSFAVEQKGNPYQSTRLLLDGQQRLTSLSAVIRGEPITVRGNKRPIEILFNLEHPDQLALITEVADENDIDDDEDDIDDENDADATEDELQKRFDKMTFLVATSKIESLPQWVKVSDVFKTDEDAPFLSRAGVEKISDPLYKKYSQRLARLRSIKKYIYRMDVLERSLSYEEVTEIFVRVNSLGAKLRGSDLALAQITAKWRGSLEIFQEFQKKCAKAGFDFDLGIHLKNMVVFATNQSRFQSVGNLPVEKVQTAWKESCEGMEFAVNFMKNNVGIDTPVLLASPFLLIVLAYYGFKRDYTLGAEEENLLRYWALVANAKGRFSRGSSETILDQDIAVLRDAGGVELLIERLRSQVGRLDISPDEFEGRNQRSALFKTMFLAFRAAGAKDWKSKLVIALDHSGTQHRLQFHHLFPKALLKKTGNFSQREIDDISNLAFIGGKINKIIRDNPPVEYFPSILADVGKESFEKQCIPLDESLLDTSKYKDFLAERRKFLAARLNEFLSTDQKV